MICCFSTCKSTNYLHGLLKKILGGELVNDGGQYFIPISFLYRPLRCYSRYFNSMVQFPDPPGFIHTGLRIGNVVVDIGIDSFAVARITEYDEDKWVEEGIGNMAVGHLPNFLFQCLLPKIEEYNSDYGYISLANLQPDYIERSLNVQLNHHFTNDILHYYSVNILEIQPPITLHTITDTNRLDEIDDLYTSMFRAPTQEEDEENEEG